MKNLVTMTAFVLERKKYWKDRRKTRTSNSYRTQHSMECEKYAKFLEAPLALSMFISCNDNGDQMSKPKYTELDAALENGVEESDYWFHYDRYQDALKKILFEDWRENAWGASNDEADVTLHFESDKDEISVITKELVLESERVKEHKKDIRLTFKFMSVEQLIQYGIELIPTENCLKQLGL